MGVTLDASDTNIFRTSSATYIVVVDGPCVAGGTKVGTGGASVGTGGPSVFIGTGGASVGTGGPSVFIGTGGASVGTGGPSVFIGTGGASVGTGGAGLNGEEGKLNSKKYHVSTMFQKNQTFYNNLASASH